MTRRGPRRRAGVTLIELLVVLAIMGILAAIAYPSYQVQVARGWRTQAISCLEEMAQGMERRFTGAMSYVGTAPPGNSCAIDGSPSWAVLDADLAGRYQFGFASAPGRTTYGLRAVPIGRQAADDARCGTLSLDQAGRRGASGGAPVGDCW
jgi:type IV pilus assembly protein PilE